MLTFQIKQIINKMAHCITAQILKVCGEWTSKRGFCEFNHNFMRTSLNHTFYLQSTLWDTGFLIPWCSLPLCLSLSLFLSLFLVSFRLKLTHYTRTHTHTHWLHTNTHTHMLRRKLELAVSSGGLRRKERKGLPALEWQSVEKKKERKNPKVEGWKEKRVKIRGMRVELSWYCCAINSSVRACVPCSCFKN